MELKSSATDKLPTSKSNLSAVIASTMPANPAPTTSLTSDGRKPCNCTKSQCLKLYCDCFAMGSFCYDCNCVNCFNTLEREDERNKAIKMILDRNPQAFQSKIGKFANQATADVLATPEPKPDLVDELGGIVQSRHIKGCNCKKSNCLKRYCECYLANIQCSSLCKCVGCKNCDDPNRTLSAQATGHDSETDMAAPATASIKPIMNYTRIKLTEITAIQPSNNSSTSGLSGSKAFEAKNMVSVPSELTSILKSTLHPQPIKENVDEKACSRLIDFVANNYKHLDEILSVQNEQTFSKNLELVEELILREFGAFLNELV